MGVRSQMLEGKQEGRNAAKYLRAVRLSLSYDLLEPKPVVSDLFRSHSQQTSLKKAVGERRREKLKGKDERVFSFFPFLIFEETFDGHFLNRVTNSLQ